MSKTSPSGNVIVLAVATLASVVVLSVVLLVVFAPKDTDVVGVLTILLGFLTTTIATLVTLGRVQAVDQKVEYLANGGTDAKIRAGIADVVRPELLKPDADEQLEADRAHRAAGPGGH